MSLNPFNRVGKFIKSCALILWALGVFAGIIVGSILMIKVELAVGILAFGAFAFIATFSTMFLYAFGEITDRVVSIEEYLLNEQKAKIQQKNGQIAEKAETRRNKDKNTESLEAVDLNKYTDFEYPEYEESVESSEADDLNEYVDFECPECGETVSFTKGELKKNSLKRCPFCNADIF